MSKKFLVNGVELICVDETKFDDVRKQFKENVTVDDLESWQSKKEMEQYTATAFIDKARFYLSQSPPDLVQSSEKIWFAAVFAVKKLFLSSGGINLKSHKALNYFCRFALAHSGLTADRIIFLIDCWTKAIKMYQDVYGSWNFRSNEYVQIITDVETFVKEFDNFDQRKLWDEFERTFIVGTEQNVTEKINCVLKTLGDSFSKKDMRGVSEGITRLSYLYSINGNIDKKLESMM